MRFLQHGLLAWLQSKRTGHHIDGDPHIVHALHGCIDMHSGPLHLQEVLPEGLGIASIEGGFATLRSSNGAYEARLTLVPAPQLPELPPARSSPPPEGTPVRLDASPAAQSSPVHISKKAKPTPAAAVSGQDGARAQADANGGASLPLENGDTAMADASTEDGPEPSTRDGAGEGFATDGPDKWRWRLAGIDVLPGRLAQGCSCVLGPAVHPAL